MKGDGVLDRYALRRLVREAGLTLAAAGVASPEHDARVLAEWLLGRPLPLVDGADAAFTSAYAQALRRRNLPVASKIPANAAPSISAVV